MSISNLTTIGALSVIDTALPATFDKSIGFSELTLTNLSASNNEVIVTVPEGTFTTTLAPNQEIHFPLLGISAYEVSLRVQHPLSLAYTEPLGIDQSDWVKFSLIPYLPTGNVTFISPMPDLEVITGFPFTIAITDTAPVYYFNLVATQPMSLDVGVGTWETNGTATLVSLLPTVVIESTEDVYVWAYSSNTRQIETETEVNLWHSPHTGYICGHHTSHY